MLTIPRIWRVTLNSLRSTFIRPATYTAMISTASTSGSVSNAIPPPNWKRSAPSPPSSSLTVAAQSGLQRLPVPDLSATLAKLKESLRPLADSEEELREAERKIDEFANGLGPAFQERLVQRQKEGEHWLEEWWDNGAYMGYRDSVCY